MQLRPSFFEQHYPKFAIFTICKAWSIVSCGEIVIYDNWRFNSVDEEFNKVDSGSVYILCNKDIFDSLLTFSQRTQNCQKVTVSKCTLVYIVRMNTVTKYTRIWKKFWSSLPLNAVCVQLVVTWFYQWSNISIELKIGPLGTSLNDFLNEFFRLRHFNAFDLGLWQFLDWFLLFFFSCSFGSETASDPTCAFL